MPSTEPIRVTIFNQTYSVAATADGADIEELAHMVDELMTTISRAGNFDSTRTAVLACLHLADQLRTVQREIESIKLEVDSKAKQFSERLEKALGDPSGA